MANYAKIKLFNTSNGEGIRTAIFFTGCDFGCEGCFNSEIWDANAGTLFDKSVETYIFSTISEHIAGISILGGEPFHENNISAVESLCEHFKEKYPNKTIWVWTGNTFDQIKNLPVMNYIDVLVDGRFIQELKMPNLKWKGSANQRVIDVKASIMSGTVVEKN